MRTSAFDRLLTAIGVSVGIAVCLIACLVSFDVVSRAAFRMSNSWITEMTTYLLAYITFVGAGYALREGSHVGVDLLVVRLSAAAGRRVSILASVMTTLVAGCLTWLSFEYFHDAWASGETSDTLLSVRLWIPYLSFFVGMLGLSLVAIAGVFVSMRKQRHQRADH